MVRTRAQRVANDENGVDQSPQQVLATPKRRTVKAAGKSLNATIRDETRDESPTTKSKTKSKTAGTKESKKESKQESKAKAKATLAAKKARLRAVAKQVKSQTDNNITLPQDINDEDIENVDIAKASKPSRSPLEEGKAQSKAKAKDTVQNGKSTKAVVGEKTVDNSKILPAAKPNAGLSDMMSRLTPQKLETQPQVTSSEAVAPLSNNKEKSASPLQSKVIKSNKPKSKEQRALQEHGANEQKPKPKKSSIFGVKRKRPHVFSESESSSEDDDIDDDIPRKKKTAKWSFKPGPEGHLTLVPRKEVDPNDLSVVFVEGTEAIKLITAEFERKKKVRFADRIAEQHPELTPEEKAEQQASLESQNQQLTAHSLLGLDLARNTDARSLARKLDAGNKSMLERVESLTTSDDPQLRQTLAKDLMELAFAVQNAGPQSKDTSPVEQSARSAWTNPQENKENKSASTSPEHSPLRIEASPTTKVTNNFQTDTSATTPGRLIASIRKIRSYLPFGGTATKPVQSPPEAVEENIPPSPASPSPAPRVEDKPAVANDKTPTAAGQTDKPTNKPLFDYPYEPADPCGTMNLGKVRPYSSDFPTFDHVPRQPKWPWDKEKYHKFIGYTPPDADYLKSAQRKRQRDSEDEVERKIGSKKYPLTPDGKIPRPGPRAWGINDAYFYEAEDSDESTSDKEKDEPLPKRRRNMKPTATTAANNTATITAKNTAQNTRLTRSAPRPNTSRLANTRPTAPRSTLKTPNPRVIAAPAYASDSSSDSEEDLFSVPSVERREKEREKMRAERLKASMDAHRPKTPSRLREMARAPRSPINPKQQFKKLFKQDGDNPLFKAFAHV